MDAARPTKRRRRLSLLERPGGLTATTMIADGSAKVEEPWPDQRAGATTGMGGDRIISAGNHSGCKHSHRMKITVPDADLPPPDRGGDPRGSHRALHGLPPHLRRTSIREQGETLAQHQQITQRPAPVASPRSAKARHPGGPTMPETTPAQPWSVNGDRRRAEAAAGGSEHTGGDGSTRRGSSHARNHCGSRWRSRRCSGRTPVKDGRMVQHVLASGCTAVAAIRTITSAECDRADADRGPAAPRPTGGRRCRGASSSWLSQFREG
jgi:hypothetical protein